MLRVVKPRNARSKRALEAREPKEIEDPRTAVFVKGSSTGEVVGKVMKELMALKRPNAISFSKKKNNTVRPFEESSIQTLEFWSAKNDASMFVVGQSTKKRPDGMTFVRMYDGHVFDMLEVGVDGFVSMEEFKNKKCTPGHRPLLHFASELFDTHPRFMQLKSMLLDFFGSEVLDGIHLGGVEHVISVQLAPTPPELSSTTGLDSSAIPSYLDTSSSSNNDYKNLPKVHLRTYTISLSNPSVTTDSTTTKTTASTTSKKLPPKIELVPMGPFLDLTLRRHTLPSPDMLKSAMRRPKLRKKEDIESGLGKRTREKRNLEVDEMGDLRGRIHLGKQDLSKLQSRKMKGRKETNESGSSDEDSEEDSENEEPTSKRRK